MIYGDAIGAAGIAVGILAGTLSFALNRRQGQARERETGQLRAELERGRVECLGEIGHLGASLAEMRRESQAHAELLHDGRMSLPVRGRAIRLLRTGMPADKAAVELGMPRSEARLLQKVVVALSGK